MLLYSTFIPNFIYSFIVKLMKVTEIVKVIIFDHDRIGVNEEYIRFVSSISISNILGKILPSGKSTVGWQECNCDAETFDKFMPVKIEVMKLMEVHVFWIRNANGFVHNILGSIKPKYYTNILIIQLKMRRKLVKYFTRYLHFINIIANTEMSLFWLLLLYRTVDEDKFMIFTLMFLSARVFYYMTIIDLLAIAY